MIQIELIWLMITLLEAMMKFKIVTGENRQSGVSVMM